MTDFDSKLAQVIAVYPDKVKIEVNDLHTFSGSFNIKVGSYLRITDCNDCALIASIENFSIAVNENNERKYIIEAAPMGVIQDDVFIRGGDMLTIPPTGVEPATQDDVRKIFEDSVLPEKKFVFSKLSTNLSVNVPVDGDKFFNKHIAVVGSTGSGKSHTITNIIQTAIKEKNDEFDINNSHVVIFDIHSEYKTAFPSANFLNVNNLHLPYWLLNSEELEEILLDTGERDNYNQSSVFKNLVTENKRKYNPTVKTIYFDSPLKFDIHEVLVAIYNIKNETVNAKNESLYMFEDDSYSYNANDKITEEHGVYLTDNERVMKYFEKKLKFHSVKPSSIKKGDYADGTLNKFYSRFESKVSQERLEFIFGKKSYESTLESTLKSLLGYNETSSNVTVVDLSGVPFEVLSITVSLISRVLFEYGYHYKVMRELANEIHNNDAPILLVYEEAHKYVPNSDLVKFRASKISIERIAKEGRKYGVTLLLSSQRPSEISETIFAQCSSFLAMRLTNPSDLNYVARLLPDTLGDLCNKLSTLTAGEALLIGESVIMPSLVKVGKCTPSPSSNDIPYFQLWKEEWKELDFESIRKTWLNQ